MTCKPHQLFRDAFPTILFSPRVSGWLCTKVLVRARSCNFVDRTFHSQSHDPRNHTNEHEQELSRQELLV